MVPSQSSSTPLHVSAGAAHALHVQPAPHDRVPDDPQLVAQAPPVPRTQARPSSGAPSQSSSAPLQDSSGGAHAVHAPPTQRDVPAVMQLVVHDIVAPPGQPAS